MHLAGVQSRYRYLLFFVPVLAGTINVLNKIDIWMLTTRSIRKQLDPNDAQTRQVIIGKYVANAFFTTTFATVMTVLPIVY